MSQLRQIAFTAARGRPFTDRAVHFGPRKKITCIGTQQRPRTENFRNLSRSPSAARVTRMAARTESYSLWLMPKGNLADRLQQEIDQLASWVADAPSFAPHVTLLGGIEQPLADVLRVAEQLADELQSYRIGFDRVSFGKIFHQCVYILCKTEAETMAAGAAARGAYGLDPNSTYMPHLSLLYSDIGQAEREALAAEMQEGLFQGAEQLAEGGFEVEAIAVWYTPGEDRSLKSWRLVKDIPLKQ